MPVKTHIPGTSVSIGYESETADRATIRCLVTGETVKATAIAAAVAAVGQTLYPGVYNIPLVLGEATRFGQGKYIVTLQYSRSASSRRRDQTQRRIRMKSTVEYVDAYLVANGTFVNGYRDNAAPATADWFSIQMRPGNLQTPELYPRPYKLQRPMMTIQLEYTTTVLTVNDAELQKTGKLNNSAYVIPEIGGVFQPDTLKYEGFSIDKKDIGQYPWFTSIVFTYDPFGHFRQQVLWDQTLSGGNGAWKTDSTNKVAESVAF